MDRKQIKRVRNAMRQLASQVVRNEVLKLNKVLRPALNKRGNLQDMVHHPCSHCSKFFRPDEVELDHVQEVGEFKIEGPLRGSKYGDCRIVNLQTWFERLFCDISNFQILCIRCHQKKTLSFNTKGREDRIKNLWGEDLL